MMHLDRLPNQEKHERVVFCLHRHWIHLVRIVAILVFVTAVPAVFAWFFQKSLVDLLAHSLWGAVITILVSIYLLCAWGMAFSEYIDYQLDVWIVTNLRILNTEQNGLFNRVTSELNLAAIQDVTAEVKGVLPTLLDYGDVFIQTAAEHVRFVFKDVDNPEEIKQKIVQLVDDAKAREPIMANAPVIESPRKNS